MIIGEKQLMANALDGLMDAMNALNDIENMSFEIEVIQSKLENAYDHLLLEYEA